MSRYTPARDALTQAWRELRDSEAGGTCGVDKIAAIICKSLESLSGQPMQDSWKIWTSNCGRNVSRHMGPHDLPKRIGLVRPHVQEQAKSKVHGRMARGQAKSKVGARGGLQLVSSGRTYVKCKLTAAVRGALQKHVDFGMQLRKCKALSL